MVTVCRVFDRILCILVIAAVAPVFAADQQPREEPASFIVQLAYAKTDVTSHTASTCIAVLPDGHFHLEKSWAASPTVGSGMQVFEGTLSDENLKSLTAILAVDDLKGLTPVDHPIYLGMLEREIFRAIIPRPEGPQYLALVGRGALAKQSPKPLPVAVNPLIQWIEATRKQVEKQKDFFVKGGKAR